MCLSVLGCGCADETAGPVRRAEGPASGLHLPAIFSDHMVLQHGQPVPVWGWAEEGTEVTVTFGPQRKMARVASDTGRWEAQLDPLEPGGPFTLTVAGDEEITVEDVLVGDVWLCSGQSNMKWPVRGANNAEEEIAGAADSHIRLITIPVRGAERPERDFEGGWLVCRPETVADFSAVGYFFGRALRREVDLPIGLIDASRGGASCEAWINRDFLEDHPRYRDMLESWDRLVASYDPEQVRAKYQLEITRWNDAALQARALGLPAPRQPEPPSDPRTNELRPANLYNGMLAPIAGFALRGVIWYQGEANRFRAYEYRTMFPDLIRSWRAEWNQGEFPFYFVQLANIGDVLLEPSDSEWAELREAQSMALAVPNTGQAVAIDLGEPYNIHPRNKLDVGRRLALWALAHVYGKDVVYSGPAYVSSTREGPTMILSFDHVAEGLTALGGEPLQGFAIAGADRKFRWADARIDRQRVVVSSPDVPEPVAVRYGWAANPVCNLYNSAELPASPFRTDDWPGLTSKTE